MTEKDREILNQFAETLIPEIKAVSKRFAPSVEYEVNDDGLFITANEHIITLIEGRKPTRPNAPRGNPNLQQILLAWIKSKGITPRKNANGVIPTLVQLSFAMSISMHLYGDLLWQSKTRRDIFKGIFTQSRFDALFSQLEDEYYTMTINNL